MFFSCCDKSMLVFALCSVTAFSLLTLYYSERNLYLLWNTKGIRRLPISTAKIDESVTSIVDFTKSEESRGTLQNEKEISVMEDETNVIEITAGNVPEKDEERFSINDIVITIKTSGKFHLTRISLILNTWWNQAKSQIYFFTDVEDEALNNFTGGHFINTKCPNTHSRPDLSCKMEVEYMFSQEKDKKWWCHFDDDVYVNTELLTDLLRQYTWNEDVYLGKPSVKYKRESIYMNKTYLYRFAHGGSGICVSRALSKKMHPWLSNGAFRTLSRILTVPDDVTMGFVINSRLGVNLTSIQTFNSHRDHMFDISEISLYDQITLSYRTDENVSVANVINLDQGMFSVDEDPTRFLSFHCTIYPKEKYCSNKTLPL